MPKEVARALKIAMARMLLIAVILPVFALGEGLVLAYPALPTSQRREIHEKSPQLLLARRRRRHHRGHRRPRHRRRGRRGHAAIKTVRRPKEAAAPRFPHRSAPTKAATDPSTPPPTPNGALRRGARVEFDGRLVQGQTAKSGAIYLFARKRSELKSMVKERTTYRREILRTVYPNFKVR